MSEQRQLLSDSAARLFRTNAGWEEIEALGITEEHRGSGADWDDACAVLQAAGSWRSEYGNDRYWSERLGRAVIVRGADAFWNDLVKLSG